MITRFAPSPTGHLHLGHLLNTIYVWRLAQLLGRPTPPTFLHHPLILGADGEKLSKSRRDTSLRELRAAGLTPVDVIARAEAAIAPP